MRLRRAMYVLLFALTACGSSSAASDASTTAAQPAPAHAAACGPSDGRTLAASKRARVYAKDGNVYGCAVGPSRSYLLGAEMRSLREGRAGPVAVAGRDAGYGLASFGVDTITAQVVVRNLRSGKQLRALPATTAVLPESFQTVSGVVVKADGAVAWISSVSSVVSHGASTLEVHRADSRGPALLDSASTIDPRSLHLKGSTLSWRDGSELRTATLR